MMITIQGSDGKYVQVMYEHAKEMVELSDGVTSYSMPHCSKTISIIHDVLNGSPMPTYFDSVWSILDCHRLCNSMKFKSGLVSLSGRRCLETHAKDGTLTDFEISYLNVYGRKLPRICIRNIRDIIDKPNTKNIKDNVMSRLLAISIKMKCEGAIDGANAWVKSGLNVANKRPNYRDVIVRYRLINSRLGWLTVYAPLYGYCNDKITDDITSEQILVNEKCF